MAVVAGYQANGEVDTGFGAGGSTDVGGLKEVRFNAHPRLQADGKIVVAGAGFSEARL